MNNVISIAAVRAERLKQALSIHARNGERVIIETRTGLIAADKITCRGGFAEILNSFGDYFVVGAGDGRTDQCGQRAWRLPARSRHGDGDALRCDPPLCPPRSPEITDRAARLRQSQQRLPHAYPRAFAQPRRQLESVRRKHDDGRAVLEPSHLLALV
jgi:hypothetical protein